MKHLGWKVLRVSPEYGRTSTFATTGALGYPVGKRVTPMPNCGPLTLFKSYAHAYHFLGLLHRHQCMIVAAKYEPFVDQMPRAYALWQPRSGKSVRGPGLFSYVPPENTHTENRTEVGVRRTEQLPKGTVLASAIVCLE